MCNKKFPPEELLVLMFELPNSPYSLNFRCVAEIVILVQVINVTSLIDLIVHIQFAFIVFQAGWRAKLVCFPHACCQAIRIRLSFFPINQANG